MIDSWFRLTENGTTVRTELVAGTTTFFTLAYIIFVQPALLSSVGMDFGAVFVATCLSGSIATGLMALFANYPIAVAPGMGHNFFFAFAVVVAMEVPWPVALGGVAIAGLLFILVAGFGLRERLISSIPKSLKHAIAVGIGLLISMVGLQWGGIIVDSPGTLVTLGDLATLPVGVSCVGFLVAAIFLAKKFQGAILIGIFASGAVAWLTGISAFNGIVSAPPSIDETFLQLDLVNAFRPELFAVIFVFFFIALFDSVGTLVGVADQAGLMRNGVLPRARGALMADAVGTVVGASLGTSTVTAYIESAAGVASGGRTGFTAMVISVWFIGALFFSPLISMFAGGYHQTNGLTLYPVIAPALILVGTMMMKGVKQIAWDDPTEAVPSFLTIVIMPLSVSITDAIAFGFITFTIMKLFTGRIGEVDWLVRIFAFLFLFRYIFL